MSQDANDPQLSQPDRQQPPLRITAVDIRCKLKELIENETGLSQAAQKIVQSTIPELLVEVVGHLQSAPPTTGLGQVGRSLPGNFLMNVTSLEPLEPRLSIQQAGEETLDLSVRQAVYGRSSRNNRLVLFIGGGERSIVIRVSRDGGIQVNNHPIADSPEWENEMRQIVATELSKM
jgi:hypothetical protein